MKIIEINKPIELFNISSDMDLRMFIFRGEGKTIWPLLCKVGRCYSFGSKMKDTKIDKFPQIEVAILEDFKRRSLPYLNNLPGDDWQWLALAQHHGLPTRLLDWTENFLVAAFFAVWENYNDDSVIYACDRRKLGIGRKSESPFFIKQDVLFEPNHSTARISAQAGLFTVHKEPWEVFINESLQKFIIKKECLIKLGIILENFGFTDASLFPGLDGLARHLKHKFCFYDS